MTTTRRRAVLMALVGAFAQLAEAQNPKPKDDKFWLDDIRLGEFPKSTALQLVITSSASKVTAIMVTVGSETVEITPAELIAALRPTKPKNNECPVCGTMAAKMEKKQIICPPGMVCDGTLKLRTLKLTFVDNPLTRCKNCNAAFFRDAE